MAARTLYLVLYLKNIILYSLDYMGVSAEFSTPVCNLLLSRDTSDSVIVLSIMR
jgi:hypothetical protein